MNTQANADTAMKLRPGMSVEGELWDSGDAIVVRIAGVAHLPLAKTVQLPSTAREFDRVRVRLGRANGSLFAKSLLGHRREVPLARRHVWGVPLERHRRRGFVTAFDEYTATGRIDDAVPFAAKDALLLGQGTPEVGEAVEYELSHDADGAARHVTGPLGSALSCTGRRLCSSYSDA